MSVRNQTDCKNTNCGMSVCEPCKCKKYKSSKEMITEQELKEQCTPEFIKWMCEYAEGFGYIDYVLSQSSDLEQVRFNNIIFPLLIHRAVEWIKIIYSDPEKVWYNNIYGMQCFRFKNYQPKILTHTECAILHCLLDVFKQEESDE